MSTIVVNTTSIKNNIDTLNSAKQYFLNKKSSFSSSNFESCTTLATFLNNLQNTYENLSNNIKNVSEFLSDYINDIEAIENKLSGGYGSTTDSYINTLLNRNVNSITPCYIDEVNIFQTTNYVRNQNTYNPIYNQYNMDYITAATTAVCGLAFLEGVLNVGETLIDGGAMIVMGGCTIVDYFAGTDSADAVSEYIEYDWSKEAYYWATSASGLDQYVDPDCTAAQVCSTIGNIAGNVGISILTGGLGASFFGAGTVAASTFTSVTGSIIGGLSAAGGAGEEALMQGANNEEALTSAGIEAIYGSITGGISGKLDAAARGSQGLGQIAKYSFSSFGLGASESLVSEVADTLIYQNDGQTGFINNFFNNASNDGLLMEMLLSGGMNSLGTIGNYVSERISVKDTSNIGSSNSSVSSNKSSASSFYDEIDKKYTDSSELLKAYTSGKTNLTNEEYIKAATHLNVKQKIVAPDTLKNDLQNIFNGDYLIGVHRTGWEGDANLILENGLNLTGHLSSGAVYQGIDLENNITFVNKNSNDSIENMDKLLNFLSEGATYKRYGDAYGYGDAVLVKIPINDLDNFNNLIEMKNGTPVLKAEYIAGKVSSSIDDNGKIHLKDMETLSDINLAKTALNLKDLDLDDEGAYFFMNQNLLNDDSNIQVIKADNINDVPDDIFSYFVDPERVIIEVNGKKYNYSEFTQFSNRDVTALLGKATTSDITNWNKEGLRNILHTTFDSTYGYDVIEREVVDKIQIVDANDWKNVLRERGLRENTLGFVDGNNVQYLPSNANMHTAVHESLHKVSELSGKKVYDHQGNIYKVTGIREFYTDGFNSTWANETLTEYLASKYSDGKIYGSMYGESNVVLWDRIDGAIAKVDDKDLLGISYFNNDTSFIRNFFDKYAYENAYYDFIRSLPNYYMKEHNDTLNKIVTQLEKNVYKENHPVMFIIKSIFGGSWT